MALANILFLKIEAKKPCGGGELTSGQPTVCKQVQITLFTVNHYLLSLITQNLFCCFFLSTFFHKKNLFIVYYCLVPVTETLFMFIICLFSLPVCCCPFVLITNDFIYLFLTCSCPMQPY
jgi:hypothetical protein